MDVTVIRHGTAEDHAANDFDRALTARGRVEAEKAAVRVTALGAPPPDSIVSSPLLRARQSAEVVANRLGFSAPIAIAEALVPDASPEGIRNLLSGLGDRRHVVLVSHEPILSAACALLTGGPVPALRRAEVISMRGAGTVTSSGHGFAIRFRG